MTAHRHNVRPDPKPHVPREIGMPLCSGGCRIEMSRSTSNAKVRTPYHWDGECPTCRLRRLGAAGIRLYSEVYQ